MKKLSKKQEKLKEIFKTAGGEVRFRIAAQLEHGELLVGDISEKTSIQQPLISRELPNLVRMMIVAKKKKGREVFCSLTELGKQLLSIGI